MSAQGQFQSTKNRTTNISDSYNTTDTVNRVFDNAGNSNVYVNSKKKTSAQPDNNQNLIIAAAVVAAALIIGKAKG